MATKLTRRQPTRLPCVGCDASSTSQTSVKAKNHPRAKNALQQIWDDLPQTTINKAINDFRICMNACVAANGGHFEHDVNWVVA